MHPFALLNDTFLQLAKTEIRGHHTQLSVPTPSPEASTAGTLNSTGRPSWLSFSAPLPRARRGEAPPGTRWSPRATLPRKVFSPVQRPARRPGASPGQQFTDTVRAEASSLFATQVCVS